MKSFFKFLSRNKLYAAIEVVCLSVSLAFVVIIGTYAWQQREVARENPFRKEIYLPSLTEYPGLTYGVKDALAGRFPEVEEAVRFSNGYSDNGLTTWIGENAYLVKLVATDKEFFSVFPNYKLLSGSPEALDAATNVFVSETFAKKFPDGDPVGKVLKLRGRDHTIAGVFKDFKGTFFPYTDVIVGWQSHANIARFGDPFDQFGNTLTFLKVKKGTDRKALYDKIEKFCKEIYPSTYGTSLFEKLDLPRMDELFFRNYSGKGIMFNQGDAKRLCLLSLIGVLLLLSAVFNYINLNMALTLKRAKEMATRRLVGADRRDIFWKYVSESLVLTAFCVLVAVLLAVAGTPSMNTLLGSDVPIRVSFGFKYVLALVALTLVVGTLSGLLPAVLASRFKPIDIIKGSFRASGKKVFSKVFIVLQSALAVFLIAMAIVMEAQFRKSLNRPLHAEIADTYWTCSLIYTDETSREYYTLRDELAKLPCVKEIGRAQGIPGMPGSGQYSLTRDGQEILYRTYKMDSTAFRMLHFEVLEDFGTPLVNSVWFSESAFAATGFDDSYHDISQTLSQKCQGCEQVAGVIENVPVSSSNQGDAVDYLIAPILSTEDMVWGGWLLKTVGDHKDVRRQIRDVYVPWAKDTFGGVVEEPLYDGFVEDIVRDGLREGECQMRLVEIFMLIAVLISLLGLVAMSAYYADESSKDIAVRKVFGGTVGSETRDAIHSYMDMVLVACVIGVPVSVWAAGRYLRDFIVRLDGYWWIFVVAVLLSLLFAFLSVFWQTLRSARADPATELKKE